LKDTREIRTPWAFYRIAGDVSAFDIEVNR
jgi:hypothetical protein